MSPAEPDDPLARILRADDLDELAAAYDALPAATPDERVRSVVDNWDDPQAVANVVMHPDLIPEDLRARSVLRALREPDHPYLRLAGAVGAGRLGDDPTRPLDEDLRRRLLDALLDVIAVDAGPAGVRAAAEVGPLVRRADLPLLADLAAHPVEAVRHNLDQAALGVLDPDAQRPVLLPYLPDLANYPAARPST